MVQFKILGPVRAFPDPGGADLLEPLPPQQKLLVAMLAAADGHPVPADRLISLLWGPYELGSSRGKLQTCASRARAALRQADEPDDPLPARDGAYRLRATPAQLDVSRFHGLAASARTAASQHDDAAAARLTRQAMAEWVTHGRLLNGPEPLAGLPGDWAAGYRRTLRREYHDVLIGRFRADLRLGRHQQILLEMTALADADDDGRADEQLAVLIMLAAYRSGRQDEARHAFQRLKDALASQGGLEPSKETRMLSDQIRRQDPALDFPGALAVPDPRAAGGPAGDEPETWDEREARNETGAGAGEETGAGEDETAGARDAAGPTWPPAPAESRTVNYFAQNGTGNTQIGSQTNYNGGQS